MGAKLKPCPFCGSEADAFHNTKFGWQVSCENDDCFMNQIIVHDFFSFEEEAIRAWNRRTDANEPRLMTLEEAIETVSKEGGFVWIEEKNHPLSSPHIRPTNSIYDCPVRKFKDYGKEFVPKRNTLRNMWRCWTSFPTKEQREATPWN